MHAIPRTFLDDLERSLKALAPAASFPHQRLASSCLDLRRDLADLLVAGRPGLEREGLLNKPYQLLQEAGVRLEQDLARDPASASLAPARLLPVPGQWRRLNSVQDGGGLEGVRAFLGDETARIRRKTDKKAKAARAKGLKHKPWNFLQVLKPPVSGDEKGVLRIFSMPYLLAQANVVRRLGERYMLLVEPAAGVNLRHEWMRAFLHAETPPIIGAAGAEDRAFLQTQDCLTVELAHSDYLPANEDVPLGEPKRFDLLLIGLYDEMERKRHGFLLDMLAGPKLSSATALVLGRGSDESFGRFLAMADERGVSDRVTALANVPRREVPELIAACRLGLNLSLHENGCRAIAEHLRSDVPVAVSACTAGVNFDQINSRTGLKASDPDMPAALADALSRLGDFSPREWFLEHSGHANSSRELNRRLQDIFRSLSMKWTRDIIPLTSSGAHRHADPEDLRRLLPHYRDIAELLEDSPEFDLPLEAPDV